ncbi:hypothetical protein FQA39_LY15047 [Lamprigera yunnana]|nr:hypothetical protein FQA39_LY15047 [Lamprigera yunnana]
MPNLRYEIDDGGEELMYFDERFICLKEPLHLANIIVGKIVNEILDNALDIVTESNNTSATLKEVENNSLTSKLTETKLLSEHNCLDIISDLVESLEKKPEKKTFETLNKNNANDLESNLNIWKQTDNLFSDQVVDTIEIKGGIGVQTIDENLDYTYNRIASEYPKTIENKSHVTDLLKNSLHINERKKKIKETRNEQEQIEETLIRVIELGNVKSNMSEKENIHFAGFDNRSVNLGSKKNDDVDDEANNTLEIPTDNDTDAIDISVCIFNKENGLLANNRAKGDQEQNSSQFNMSFSDNSIIIEGNSNDEHLSTKLKNIEALCEQKKKETKLKRKKWNLGTKLWRFLKKNNKQSSFTPSKNS